jgi:hypothetical protein
MANSTLGLRSPKEFLQHVVDQDMADFGAPDQAELRLAYHACNSLFALRDWVYETHKGKTWTFHSTQFQSIANKGTFLKDLCTVEADFELVSDIANASKHMVLRADRRLTKLSGSANVHIQTSGGGMLGFGAIGEGAIGEGPSDRVIVEIDLGFRDVLQCAVKVHNAWKQLFIENQW